MITVRCGSSSYLCKPDSNFCEACCGCLLHQGLPAHPHPQHPEPCACRAKGAPAPASVIQHGSLTQYHHLLLANNWFLQSPGGQRASGMQHKL